MTIAPCRWCGLAHGALCPAVKRLDFDDAGAVVVGVEFFPAAETRAPPAEAPDYPRKGPAAWKTPGDDAGSS